MEITVHRPADLSDVERRTFIEFVRLGGEVDGKVLATNIASAKALVFLRKEGQVKGIAAVKCPLPNYRKRIGESAKVKLPDADFPYELGYVFVVPAVRGQKLSSPLVTNALEAVPGSGVFATARTDNPAMRGVLLKAGFRSEGETYRGRSSRTLQIFIRPA